MRPLQFVDPRDVAPLRVDRAALEVLAESGLQLTPRSVLNALLDSGSAPDAEARVAAKSELQRRGLALDARTRPDAAAALLWRSLELVAAPDAEVRVASQRPGADEAAEPERSYFLGADGIAPVTWLDDGLEVHAALRADVFATQLSKLFQPSPAPKDFAPFALTRSQVEAARLAWGEGATAAQSVTRAQAVANVRKFDVEGGDAAGLVELLLQTQVVVEAAGVLSLAPGVREALAALWSGESHELVVRDLVDDASPDEPEGVGVASFYVVGPAGQRVILDMSEAPLDEAGGEGEAPAQAAADEALDSEVLQFTWLTRDEMGQSLEALLGLLPE
jgi:hypothetical protein